MEFQLFKEASETEKIVLQLKVIHYNYNTTFTLTEITATQKRKSMLESTEPRHRWQSCQNNKMANGDRAANYLHYKDARHNYSLLDSVK